MAAAKKARAVEFEGAEHTDHSLAAMKTGEIAALVARMRGEAKTPKPATKTKAIELFWKAAEELQKRSGKPKAKASSSEATAEPRGAAKGASERKAKTYSVRIDRPEDEAKVAAMNPAARRLAAAIRDAGCPLTMAECAAIAAASSKTKRPDKLVAWHFCQLFRPAGILVESRQAGSHKNV